LGYTIPRETLERVSKGWVSDMRIYVAAQNLFTITDYLGFDPEVTRNQSFQKGEFPLASGTDGGVSPMPRIWQVGWSVTF
jgi:hypothetical protein